MEYTVKRLASLAGVSARTLRYYDQIGLLTPARVNSSGYRIYGRAEVDRLQQILFYRELGVNLDRIREIVTQPGFDNSGALQEHREQLLAERARLDLLIGNVEKTIAHLEGGPMMSDKEKFAGFKQKLIEDNEQKFGKEVRERWGEKAAADSNRVLLNMSEEQHAELQQLSETMMQTLKAAHAAGDPAGELAQQAADLHRKWLSSMWQGGYSKEAHAGLAQMYVDDERFTAYYDKEQPGLARFLREAILIFTGMQS